MKVIILSTALLTIVVCATIGLIYSNKEKSTMNSILNTKGLPEQGLIFIEPTDAYYQQVTNTAMRNQTSPDFDALKPFSVLLKNNSNKVLIAFKLKWEVEDSNGQVTTTTNGYMNSRRLFNVEDRSKTKSVLDLNEATFCSVAGVTAINQLSDAQASGIATTSILRRDGESTQPELPTGNSDAGKVELMKRLTEARKITVVLDGALFEDGTFIGPDSSNFYGWLSSLIESRRDLIQNLKTIQHDGNPSKVQERLQEENRVPRISLGPHSTYDDFYKFNRKSFAQSLLRLKNAVGDDAIRRELETSDERWLKLQKF